MLPDSVLIALTKPTPLRARLLKAAWPTLSTESKLQLIDAMASRAFRTVSGYVTDLALADGAEIVRYWAAWSSNLYRQVISDTPPHSDTWDVELQRAAQAHNDESELVRAAAAAASPDCLGLSPGLETSSQLTRLIRIQHLRRTDNDSFVDFVERSLNDPRVAEADLCDCLIEYFNCEAFQQQFVRLDVDTTEPWEKGRGLRKLWEITRRAPERVRNTIARLAPIEGNGWELGLNVMLSLPDDVKVTLRGGSAC